MFKIYTLNRTEFLNLVQQFGKTPCYMESFNRNALEVIMFCNLKIQPARFYIYNKKILYILRHVAIYRKKNQENDIGVFFTTQANTGKCLHINNKIDINEEMDWPVRLGTFEVGGPEIRESVVLKLLESTQLLGYVAYRDFMMYFFGIKFQDKNAILIVGRQNAKLIIPNKKILKKIEYNTKLTKQQMIDNSVYVEEISPGVYDCYMINYIPHSLLDHHPHAYKIIIARVDSERVIKVNLLSDECLPVSEGVAENNYDTTQEN